MNFKPRVLSPNANSIPAFYRADLPRQALWQRLAADTG
jgi:hypothetical protein